ncbi:MAG: hypothetical protein GXP16_17005 [Gammaproteobacteria bacterium]|nr:hypothetical protein [Gammaproteobacteria bacterium]
MKHCTSVFAILIALIHTGPVSADSVSYLQKGWAHAVYELTADDREKMLSRLADAARLQTSKDNTDPSLHIWQGIVLSTLAGERGGLGALGLAKEAKRSLEKAISLDRLALNGSALTSIGTLYHKVPGWPISFGSDKKARKYLRAALDLNPDGIDPNYFMGEFLYDEGEYEQAKRHLIIAANASPRNDRPIADKGRQTEISVLLGEVERHLN